MSETKLADVVVSALLIAMGILVVLYAITGAFPLEQAGDFENILSVLLGGGSIAGGLANAGAITE